VPTTHVLADYRLYRVLARRETAPFLFFFEVVEHLFGERHACLALVWHVFW
jgi:hypothetical protein